MLFDVIASTFDAKISALSAINMLARSEGDFKAQHVSILSSKRHTTALRSVQRYKTVL